MEKLNELVELAKKATQGKWWIDSHGHSMVSFSGNEMEIVFVTKSDAMSEAKRHDDTGNLSHWRNDNDASFIAAANPKNILAIDEAYRALEQRAEAAEAKLAEMEKQEPVVVDDEMALAFHKSLSDGGIGQDDLEEIKVGLEAAFCNITRLAPAINLAELVNDDEFRASFERWMIDDMKCVIGSSDPYPAGIEARNWNAWKACRVAILRNIEEAK